jgi:hypothetical protein
MGWMASAPASMCHIVAVGEDHIREAVREKGHSQRRACGLVGLHTLVSVFY